MGLCGAKVEMTEKEREELKAEQVKSKEVDRALVKEQETDKKVLKLLLLGAGESGKSTLFKQCNTLYGKGFTEADRINLRTSVYNNIIQAMKELVKQAPKYGGVTDRNSDAKKYLEDCQLTDEVDDTMARHIHALWADSGIQTTFDHRSEYQLIDSAPYYFNRILEIGKDGYVPSAQDMLRTRVRTTGIVENEFLIEGHVFRMFDVGGQRNERKKWIHCFENVQSILYVAAISEYDQVLFEDQKTNRMHESLELFDKTVNSKWFVKTSIILFLNKRDLFQEKLQAVPITVAFPTYEGNNDYESCVDFIRKEFTKLVHSPDKQIYIHVTCATDTDNISHVFNSVKDTIIRQALDAIGFM